MSLLISLLSGGGGGGATPVDSTSSVGTPSIGMQIYDRSDQQFKIYDATATWRTYA